MRFAPYLNLNDVKAVTKKYKGFSFLDYQVPFIRYSSYFGLIADGLLSNFGIHRHIDTKYKGFREKDVAWNNSFDKFKAANPKGILIHMNKSSIEKFRAYVESIIQEGIIFVTVYPPHTLHPKI